MLGIGGAQSLTARNRGPGRRPVALALQVARDAAKGRP